MNERRAPSAGELYTRLLAKLNEIRRTLDQTASTVPLPPAQQAEYRRLMDALESLERRVREMLESSQTRGPRNG